MPVPRCVRPAGVAVVVGMGPNEETGVPLAFIQTSEITLTGTFRYANTYPTAIDLAATGKVDLDAMVTSHYNLADTEEALQASGKDPANVKLMVMLVGALRLVRAVSEPVGVVANDPTSP